MGPIAPEQCHWIIQPLVDAGLEPERIRAFVFQVSFDAIVDGGHGHPERLAEVVRNEPAQIRSAWSAVISRMLMLDPG